MQKSRIKAARPRNGRAVTAIILDNKDVYLATVFAP